MTANIMCFYIMISGVALIANALMEKKNLKSLALTRNSLTKDGVAPLVQLLKSNPSVTELNLANNSIG